jgi:hypothetical protein
MGMTTYVAIMISTSPSVVSTQTPTGDIVARLLAGKGVGEGSWGAMLDADNSLEDMGRPMSVFVADPRSGIPHPEFLIHRHDCMVSSSSVKILDSRRKARPITSVFCGFLIVIIFNLATFVHAKTHAVKTLSSTTRCDKCSSSVQNAALVMCDV